jgi:hypothetical protein
MPDLLGTFVIKRSKFQQILLDEKKAIVSIMPVRRILYPKFVPTCPRENCTP